MEILKAFKQLTDLLRETGDIQNETVRLSIMSMNALLLPYGLRIYEHHDEYCWVDVFIASIESPIDGL